MIKRAGASLHVESTGLSVASADGVLHGPLQLGGLLCSTRLLFRFYHPVTGRHGTDKEARSDGASHSATNDNLGTPTQRSGPFALKSQSQRAKGKPLCSHISAEMRTKSSHQRRERESDDARRRPHSSHPHRHSSQNCDKLRSESTTQKRSALSILTKQEHSLPLKKEGPHQAPDRRFATPSIEDILEMGTVIVSGFTQGPATVYSRAGVSRDLCPDVELNVLVAPRQTEACTISSNSFKQPTPAPPEEAGVAAAFSSFQRLIRNAPSREVVSISRKLTADILDRIDAHSESIISLPHPSPTTSSRNANEFEDYEGHFTHLHDHNKRVVQIAHAEVCAFTEKMSFTLDELAYNRGSVQSAMEVCSTLETSCNKRTLKAAVPEDGDSGASRFRNRMIGLIKKRVLHQNILESMRSIIRHHPQPRRQLTAAGIDGNSAEERGWDPLLHGCLVRAILQELTTVQGLTETSSSQWPVSMTLVVLRALQNEASFEGFVAEFAEAICCGFAEADNVAREVTLVLLKWLETVHWSIRRYDVRRVLSTPVSHTAKSSQATAATVTGSNGIVFLSAEEAASGFAEMHNRDTFGSSSSKDATVGNSNGALKSRRRLKGYGVEGSGATEVLPRDVAVNKTVFEVDSSNGCLLRVVEGRGDAETLERDYFVTGLAVGLVEGTKGLINQQSDGVRAAALMEKFSSSINFVLRHLLGKHSGINLMCMSECDRAAIGGLHSCSDRLTSNLHRQLAASASFPPTNNASQHHQDDEDGVVGAAEHDLKAKQQRNHYNSYIAAELQQALLLGSKETARREEDLHSIVQDNRAFPYEWSSDRRTSPLAIWHSENVNGLRVDIWIRRRLIVPLDNMLQVWASLSLGKESPHHRVAGGSASSDAYLRALRPSSERTPPSPIVGADGAWRGCGGVFDVVNLLLGAYSEALLYNAKRNAMVGQIPHNNKHALGFGCLVSDATPPPLSPVTTREINSGSSIASTGTKREATSHAAVELVEASEVITIFGERFKIPDEERPVNIGSSNKTNSNAADSTTIPSVELKLPALPFHRERRREHMRKATAATMETLAAEENARNVASPSSTTGPPPSRIKRAGLSLGMLRTAMVAVPTSEICLPISTAAAARRVAHARKLPLSLSKEVRLGDLPEEEEEEAIVGNATSSPRSRDNGFPAAAEESKAIDRRSRAERTLIRAAFSGGFNDAGIGADMTTVAPLGHYVSVVAAAVRSEAQNREGTRMQHIDETTSAIAVNNLSSSNSKGRMTTSPLPFRVRKYRFDNSVVEEAVSFTVYSPRYSPRIARSSTTSIPDFYACGGAPSSPFFYRTVKYSLEKASLPWARMVRVPPALHECIVNFALSDVASSPDSGGAEVTKRSGSQGTGFQDKGQTDAGDDVEEKLVLGTSDVLGLLLRAHHSKQFTSGLGAATIAANESLLGILDGRNMRRTFDTTFGHLAVRETLRGKKFLPRARVELARAAEDGKLASSIAVSLARIIERHGGDKQDMFKLPTSLASILIGTAPFTDPTYPEEVTRSLPLSFRQNADHKDDEFASQGKGPTWALYALGLAKQGNLHSVNNSPPLNAESQHAMSNLFDAALSAFFTAAMYQVYFYHGSPTNSRTSAMPLTLPKPLLATDTTSDELEELLSATQTFKGADDPKAPPQRDCDVVEFAGSLFDCEWDDDDDAEAQRSELYWDAHEAVSIFETQRTVIPSAETWKGWKAVDSADAALESVAMGSDCGEDPSMADSLWLDASATYKLEFTTKRDISVFAVFGLLVGPFLHWMKVATSSEPTFSPKTGGMSVRPGDLTLFSPQVVRLVLAAASAPHPPVGYVIGARPVAARATADDAVNLVERSNWPLIGLTPMSPPNVQHHFHTKDGDDGGWQLRQLSNLLDTLPSVGGRGIAASPDGCPTRRHYTKDVISTMAAVLESLRAHESFPQILLERYAHYASTDTNDGRLPFVRLRHVVERNSGCELGEAASSAMLIAIHKIMKAEERLLQALGIGPHHALIESAAYEGNLPLVIHFVSLLSSASTPPNERRNASCRAPDGARRGLSCSSLSGAPSPAVEAIWIAIGTLVQRGYASLAKQLLALLEESHSASAAYADVHPTKLHHPPRLHHPPISLSSIYPSLAGRIQSGREMTCAMKIMFPDFRRCPTSLTGTCSVLYEVRLDNVVSHCFRSKTGASKSPPLVALHMAMDVVDTLTPQTSGEEGAPLASHKREVTLPPWLPFLLNLDDEHNKGTGFFQQDNYQASRDGSFSKSLPLGITHPCLPILVDALKMFTCLVGGMEPEEQIRLLFPPNRSYGASQEAAKHGAQKHVFSLAMGTFSSVADVEAVNSDAITRKGRFDQLTLEGDEMNDQGQSLLVSSNSASVSLEAEVGDFLEKELLSDTSSVVNSTSLSSERSTIFKPRSVDMASVLRTQEALSALMPLRGTVSVPILDHVHILANGPLPSPRFTGQLKAGGHYPYPPLRYIAKGDYAFRSDVLSVVGDHRVLDVLHSSCAELFISECKRYAEGRLLAGTKTETNEMALKFAILIRRFAASAAASNELFSSLAYTSKST